MNRIISFFILATMPCLFNFCSGNHQDQDEEHEEQEKIIPLRLERNLVAVNHVITHETVRIVSGNGGYKTFPIPAIMLIPVNGKPQWIEVAPSDHIKLNIEGDNIIVQRVLLKDTIIAGCFLVTDSKGQKDSLYVKDYRILTTD